MLSDCAGCELLPLGACRKSGAGFGSDESPEPSLLELVLLAEDELVAVGGASDLVSVCELLVVVVEAPEAGVEPAPSGDTAGLLVGVDEPLSGADTGTTRLVSELPLGPGGCE